MTTLRIASLLMFAPVLALPAQRQGGQSAAEEPPLQSPDDLPVAYPTRDALTPFRNPTDVYAPPDELFRQLRIMQNIAARPEVRRTFDEVGREIVDDEVWLEAWTKVQGLGLNAGQLAQMMRLHRNAGERATAFYAAFFVDDIDHVLDLIAHIPGEPERSVREAALPRAAAFCMAHLKKRFGDLTDEQRSALLSTLPQIGSPAAKSQGLTRAPQKADALHTLRVAPFLQLLDVGDATNRAQMLWFLKQVFGARPDLAQLWLEPSLPRVHRLLHDADPTLHAEAIGLLQAIGPADLPEPPPHEQAEALEAWAKRAERRLFPPIRNINDAVVQLHPSAERDAIVTAGLAALEHSGIGDPFRGQRQDGSWYRGFRVGHLPDELVPLAIPAKAVVVSINGVPVASADELLATVRTALAVPTHGHPHRLFVEYVVDGRDRAIEYRVL